MMQAEKHFAVRELIFKGEEENFSFCLSVASEMYLSTGGVLSLSRIETFLAFVFRDVNHSRTPI